MPWRIEEESGVDALLFEVDPPQMTVDIEHNRDRFVQVMYYEVDGGLVDVAVEHIDSNTVRVSSVTFMAGTIIIL